MPDHLAILDLGPDAKDGEIDRMAERLGRWSTDLDGATASYVGRTLPHALYGGHLMWRLSFPSEQAYWDALASPLWRTEIAPALAEGSGVYADCMVYRPIRSHAAGGDKDDGIWRCLVMAIEPGTPPERVAAFERDMLLMPGHVSTIGRWNFGRVVRSSGRRRWTHVWEQEFDDLAGLEGEYMRHPVHWGYIDRWYDPESPERIVDIVCIVHAAASRNGAVIA